MSRSAPWARRQTKPDGLGVPALGPSLSLKWSDGLLTKGVN
jgi:hypothetical protein